MSQAGYDVIIVGAGSAGCALAARLTEQPDRRVLLLEAGDDYSSVAEFPSEVTAAGSMAATVPGHPSNWNFVGELMPGRNFPLARGKIIGGSSTINGTLFIRACPEDFDVWSKQNDLWSYERVLPYFRRSERDLDFDGDYHGQNGPMPVARVPTERLHPVSQAFIEASLAAGFPEEPDKNAPGPDGVGRVPRNVVDNIRMNTAITYLAQARGRSNLTVSGGTLVTKVLFDGNRAIGVEAVRDGRVVTFRADEVILSAGTVKSAHLLLLSGIGPAAQLHGHGLDVVHDSPGVGQGVGDHPGVMLNYQVRSDGMPLPDTLQPFETALNFTAPGSSVHSDVHLLCGVLSYAQMIKGRDATGKASRIPGYLKRPISTLRALSKLSAGVVVTQALRQNDLSVLVGLEAEASRGDITLKSADPTDSPLVNLNYLSEPSDLVRLRDSLKVALELLQSPSFKSIDARVVSPDPVNVRGDKELADWVKSNLNSAFHSFHSAHMGPGSDPLAVVDQHCRVHGTEGLRVADLSIVPSMRRGPAATAVMIGERVAALIVEQS